MEDKTFRMFLATVIIILLAAIGWVIWDHYYHHDHGRIELPGVHIEWDERHNPYHRRP